MTSAVSMRDPVAQSTPKSTSGTGDQVLANHRASLRDKVVYRVEFTNRLELAPPPSPDSPEPDGGNEPLWQLTGGTQTLNVTPLSHLRQDNRSHHNNGLRHGEP